MNLDSIIAEIDAEIARLVQARQLLDGVAVKKGPGRPRVNVEAATAPAKPTRRKLSVAARAKIAAAQKARWAQAKKASKTVAAKSETPK